MAIEFDEKAYAAASGAVNPPYFGQGLKVGDEAQYVVKCSSFGERALFKGTKIIGNFDILWSDNPHLPAGGVGGQVITPRAGTGFEGDVKNFAAAAWEIYRRMAQVEPARSEYAQAVRNILGPPGNVLGPQAADAVIALIHSPKPIVMVALPMAASKAMLLANNLGGGLTYYLKVYERPQVQDKSKTFTHHDWSAITDEEFKALVASKPSNGVAAQPSA